MNAAFEKFIAENVTGARPARTTLMVGLPLEGMLVEIDALAVVGS
jgi:enamine deaminase RidA (YjgF/YER057c/UK114 family)